VVDAVATGLAIELVADPSDAVPMGGASEMGTTTDDNEDESEGGMYTPASGLPRRRLTTSTTTTATEIPRRARKQTRMTNQ
jgi:hypothetical protein